MLDTNIVIHAMEGLDSVLAKLIAHEGAVLISALVLAELQRGFFKHPVHAVARQTRLNALLPQLPISAFDAAAAEAYGRIIALRGWVKGRDFDRMIAAHANSLNAVLVTNNIADFSEIPGLTLEDWSTGY